MLGLKSLISSFSKCSIRNYVQAIDQYRCISGNVFAQPGNVSTLVNFNNQKPERNLRTLLPETSKILLAKTNFPYQVRSYYTYPDSENRKVTNPEDYLNFMRIHRRGIVKKRKKVNPLGENTPFAKGNVVKLLIRKPKKPNSANRRCVLVELPSGKEMTAYVPGEKHNLQEHNKVLVKVARLRDVPGVKLKCVRGAYDLEHVVKKKEEPK